MTDRKWKTWEVIGLLVTLALGNLLHFVYEWSGDSPLTAPIAAVNESTWEHMKLLAVPWILFSLVERAARGRSGGTVPMARALGLLAGLAAIPLLYYTYRGILGFDVMAVDILIFQAAVLLGFWVSWRVQRTGRWTSPAAQIAGVLALLAVLTLFVVWTYRPPHLPLFCDPVTGRYGIQ